MSRPELGNILNILQQTPSSQSTEKWNIKFIRLGSTSVGIWHKMVPSQQKLPTYSFPGAVIRFFWVDLSDQRSDIFVCDLRGKIIEWQSHISVRTLSSHFHYLNGPIMGELKLLRYTSLFYTQLSSVLPLPLISPDQTWDQWMPSLDVFCLIMIVLTSSLPCLFEHGPLMYSFLRQH